MDDRWWKHLDAVVAATLPPASRVLDVGCGDGGLVDRLAHLGFDALGVDPRAPTHGRVIGQRVELATGLGEFDAITATMALHHSDLGAVVPTLARLLRPRGRLFVSELAWDAYDERAVAWLAGHGAAETDHSIARWREAHGALHTSSAIRQALGARFESIEEIQRPYLARMLGRPELEAEEHALIDAELLPALGVWLFARLAPP